MQIDDAPPVGTETATVPPPAPELEAEPHEEGGEHENGNGNGDNGHHVVRHRWDNEELQLLATEIARLMHKQGWRVRPEIGDREGRAMFREMFAAAQCTVLPRERRRLNTPLQAVREVLWHLVDQAVASRTWMKPKGTETAATATPETNGNGHHVNGTNGNGAHAEATATVPPEGKALVDADDPLGNVPTMVLARELLRRMMEANGVAEANARRMVELQEENAMIAEDFAKARLADADTLKRLAAIEVAMKLPQGKTEREPRVAILGCAKHEFDHIKHGAEVSGLKLDLRHYDHDRNPYNIHAEYSVMMRRVSHKWSDKVNMVIPNDKQAFIGGGINMVLTQLKSWFQR